MSHRRIGSTLARMSAINCLLLFMSSATVLGQATTASILGTAKDGTGAVLPGVTVTITNLETGLTRTVVTDEGGRYGAARLPLGSGSVGIPHGGHVLTADRDGGSRGTLVHVEEAG